MNRSLILLPLLLALAVGGWFVFGAEDHSTSPAIPIPTRTDSEDVQEPVQLPLLGQLDRPRDLSTSERTSGSLSRPQLSLLARRAAGGDELPDVVATIAPVQAETPVFTVQANASAPTATELDPGVWRVTFEAEGYVSQTREVDLELGDEEHLEVNLVRGAQITGNAQDRFGQPLGGQKLFFLAPGQAHPRFPRDAEGILTTTVDREGNIVPITLPPEMYTVTYGNLGTPKLKTEGRVNAGEDAELLIVLGGKSVVRFELDRFPEEDRRIEVRLEQQDQKKLARDQERQLKNPERAAKEQIKDKSKGKTKERWRARGQAQLKNGVGEIHRARPGVYRVTLLARPGEYSSKPILVLKEDESVVVRIQAPPLPARADNRKRDPKLPKDGPLNITVIRNPQDPTLKSDGMYWR